MKSKRKASRQCSEALLQEYHYFSQLLTNEDSTTMAQASAVTYFRRLFTENTEPPAYFDHGMIDIFNNIVSDTSNALEMRTEAAWALTNMLCSKRVPLSHAIMEKGTLDVFAWCIRTADQKLRDQCIWGVANMAADCTDCKEAVRATDVLEVMARQLHAESFCTLEATRCAIWACLNILRGAHSGLLPCTARHLLTGVMAAVRRFGDNILQDSLLTLAQLADDRNFFQFPAMWPLQIDAMIAEEGLLAVTINAVATENPAVVSPALRLIGNIITGTDAQTHAVIARAGFIDTIARSLHSPVCQVRREAAWILSNIAAGPPDHVDLILKDQALIARLLHALRHDEPRMQKEVSWVFGNVLSSLNAVPRPGALSEFLGYGVLAIVDVASRPGADSRLVNKIREVLSAVLVAHPEFWPVVEKAAVGSTALLEVPKRKRRVADYVIYDEDATEI